MTFFPLYSGKKPVIQKARKTAKVRIVFSENHALLFHDNLTERENFGPESVL